MPESIWWPDEAWWETKVLPLGFITLSFRQLGTLAFAFIIAFASSIPFQFPIAGISFGGRAAAFCIVFGVGYIISSRRVKLLPVELQSFYFLRTKGAERAKAELCQLLGSNKPEQAPALEIHQSPIFQEMVVEDFKNPVPLIVSDRVNSIQKETRALLLLDDQVRAEDSVSPQKPRYRLPYVPLHEDIGTHHLTVRLEGASEPLVSIRLLLKSGSSEIGESIVKIE
jgi:hypothetical protein